MPAYDYTCPVCGHREERIVKMEERDEQVCNRPYTLEETRELAASLVAGERIIELGQGAIGDVRCSGNLERDEIALTARMSDQWRF